MRRIIGIIFMVAGFLCLMGIDSPLLSNWEVLGLGITSLLLLLFGTYLTEINLVGEDDDEE